MPLRGSALAALLIAGCAPMTVTAPPAAIRADPFYTQYVDAGGVPVIASPRADPAALVRAARMIVQMTAHRPDYRTALGESGMRVAVLDLSEGIMELPENRGWKKPLRDDPRLTRCEWLHYDERIGSRSDAEYWNHRARGIAGPLTVVPGENVMAVPLSKHHGESITVHEFSHLLLHVMKVKDTALFADLERAYADTRAAGRWKDDYASVTIDEYWAEGTQFWFNTNYLSAFDGRQIRTDVDLAAYDPQLAAVLRAIYGERHRLDDDVFYRHPAQVPVTPTGEVPLNTAEQC